MTPSGSGLWTASNRSLPRDLSLIQADHLCDPNREWLSLLQAGLKPKSVELWGNPEEGELSLRDRSPFRSKGKKDHLAAPFTKGYHLV